MNVFVIIVEDLTTWPKIVGIKIKRKYIREYVYPDFFELRCHGFA